MTAVTNGQDFWYTLSNDAKNLKERATEASNPRAEQELSVQADLVNKLAKTWNELMLRDNWSGQDAPTTLSDLYVLFYNDVRTQHTSSTGDERKGYFLILQRLREVGVNYEA